MEYRSTRGLLDKKSSAFCILQGLAEDKGLFVPVEFPELNISFDEMRNMDYKSVAKVVLSRFLTDFSEEEIDFCVEKAYDGKFEKDEIVPVIKVGDSHIVELYHGKTSAFKDMALSILPNLLSVAMKKTGAKEKVCILTATSGDTGKAALEGFKNVENTKIVVFYPKDGVSEIQEMQMCTQEGNNTYVFGINGNFDKAQSGVKEIFDDGDFAEEIKVRGYKLSSANSINIGRLIPQIVYYVYGYGQLLKNGAIKEGEKINISVPTGNFGNILAGYYAKKMGLPINKFICASNENKVLTDFINTGVYDIKREFFVTNTPSMDILISSNLERLLYDISDCDSSLVADLMEDLKENKEYELPDKFKGKLKEFYGGFATELETKNQVKKVYDKYKYLMDTHTAVAHKVYEDYRNESKDEIPTLIISTASPYKFAENILDSLGENNRYSGFEALEKLNEKTGVPVPKELKILKEKEILHKNKIDDMQMREAVLKTI